MHGFSSRPHCIKLYNLTWHGGIAMESVRKYINGLQLQFSPLCFSCLPEGHIWFLYYYCCFIVRYTYKAAVTSSAVYTLRPRLNGRHFPDDISKWIFWKENEWILIKISLKFVPKGPINNIPSLVQIMAWCLQCDEPLSESMMIWLSTHIIVTWPQWVKRETPQAVQNKCHVY